MQNRVIHKIVFSREQGFVLLSCLSLLTILSLIVTGMFLRSRLHYQAQQIQMDSLRAFTIAEMALQQGEKQVMSIPVTILMQLSAPDAPLPQPLIARQSSHEWSQHPFDWWALNAIHFDDLGNSAYYAIEWLGFIPSTDPDDQPDLDDPQGQYLFRVTSLGQGNQMNSQVILQTTWLQSIRHSGDIEDIAIFDSQRLAWRQLG